MLCGLTGFPGFIITIWCQLRGWTKDVQRAVFQPVMLAAIVATAISLSFTGVVTMEIVKLYVLGLPALLAGLWIGFKLYGKLDDVAFRKLVLVLLLVAGTVADRRPWLAAAAAASHVSLANLFVRAFRQPPGQLLAQSRLSHSQGVEICPSINHACDCLVLQTPSRAPTRALALLSVLALILDAFQEALEMRRAAHQKFPFDEE